MSSNFIATGCAFRRFVRGPCKLAQCAVLISLLNLASIAHAYALDFFFDPIPVNVQGLKSLAGGVLMIICDVSDASGIVLETVDHKAGSSHPMQVTPDANGNYSGTMGASNKLKNANDIAKAKTYECKMYGQLGSNLHPIVVGDGSQWYHAKSGNVAVTGPIP